MKREKPRGTQGSLGIKLFVFPCAPRVPRGLKAFIYFLYVLHVAQASLSTTGFTFTFVVQYVLWTQKTYASKYVKKDAISAN